MLFRSLQKVLDEARWEKYGQGTITDRETLESQLKNVAENDVSIERDELGDGYSSIAVPVFREGKLVYTISVVSTTQLIDDSFEELIKELRAIRDQIYHLSVFQS